MAQNLTALLNYWIEKDGLPQINATAKNFFIFKGDKKEEGNQIDELRPISATTYFFKLMETILKRRIEKDIKNGYTEKIANSQYGFKKHLGTEPQILRMFLD